ncbi:chromate transporter [Gracilibacillus caseinilyticus]|uniref:Chromate transporter n=1 Tax=Gracilibacillus caseinilyticus TaxID=2932256 RepID=A0ABY4EY84_9BACI|nr:chromate transporter [Gracilibacillus caseinilyticus]UOQ49234.1 chromate transporter [Gracilibacillus caseinilyticus]
MKHFQIFWAFFKVGILGYGGGPSSIPLVHKEVVDHYKWMDNDEFSDILAIGNTLPGPIATKMAGYIGYRVSGWLGVLNAVISTILPSIIAMIFLLVSLRTFSELPWVTGMTHAIVPVVGVMLAILTWDFVKKGHKDLGWKFNAVLIIVSTILLQFLNIHPAIIIIILLIIAFTTTPREKGKEEVQ